MKINPVGKRRGNNILKQIKESQMTGPRGPVGPDNPTSDDLGLSPEFLDPANYEDEGVEWDLEDPNAPEHIRSDDFSDTVFEPQRMEDLYRLLSSVYNDGFHVDDPIATGKSILKDTSLEDFMQDWQGADPSRHHLFRKILDHFDPSKSEERDKSKAEAFESQKGYIYPGAYPGAYIDPGPPGIMGSY